MVNKLSTKILSIKDGLIAHSKVTLRDVGFWYADKPRSRVLHFVSDYQFTKTKKLSSASSNLILAYISFTTTFDYQIQSR